MTRAAQENVAHLRLGAVRVPVDEDPDAVSERSRHGDLPGAQQRDVPPFGEAAGRHGRELPLQVLGHGEERTRDVVRQHSVGIHEDLKQLPRAFGDLPGVVARDGRGAAKASNQGALRRRDACVIGPRIISDSDKECGVEIAQTRRHVLGIDAGGTKTRALLADETGRVVAGARGGGANLRTHGELEVEKVLHSVVEQAEGEAGVRAEALALGIAGADRPEDHAVLREILRRIGFRNRVVVTNDARIAFVAGSTLQVGLALICGTGSIAWGRNAGGEIARAGGWGWHLGDEGSGFWIGERAIREVLRAADGRRPATSLDKPLFEHFGIEKLEEILGAVYDGEYPRHQVAMFSVRVEESAQSGDAAAREILAEASDELVAAARSVIARLGLSSAPYDIVLSGGTFAALPGLAESVRAGLAAEPARVRRLEEEPAMGAVRLALEELKGSFES